SARSAELARAAAERPPARPAARRDGAHLAPPGSDSVRDHEVRRAAAERSRGLRERHARVSGRAVRRRYLGGDRVPQALVAADYSGSPAAHHGPSWRMIPARGRASAAFGYYPPEVRSERAAPRAGTRLRVRDP